MGTYDGKATKVMATRKTSGKSLWWEKAYQGMPHVEVVNEYVHGKDTFEPGSPVKIKNQRGVFLFRCYAKNTLTDTEWLDFIGPEKQWHSFRPEKIKGLVKPRKFRRTAPK